MTKTCSLYAQLQEVDFAIESYPSLAGKRMRASEVDLHVTRMQAVADTLKWLQAHEVEIKAFLALEPERRAAVISGGAR